MTPSWVVMLEPVALFGWALLGLTGYLLAIRGRARWGALALSVAFFWFACPLGANVMLQPFEERATAASASCPAAPGWIVVLAGGIDEAQRDGPQVEDLHGASLRRVLAGVRMAHEVPAARLVLSGGAGRAAREADLMSQLAVSMGIARERVVVERESRNTFESAAALARLARAEKPAGGTVLVTSALHMARARSAFASEGLEVCARPVDFRWVEVPWNHAFVPQISALRKSTAVVHEAGGLFYYWVSGRSR